MVSFLKKNYEFIFCIILFCVILTISLNPEPYISSTFVGLKVWATIVLPSLFVFFVLTKLFMGLNSSLKLFNFLDKIFYKLFKVKKTGGYVFFMSAISGYPIGAKLISEFYLNGTISQVEAKRLISFCSTSGPMFILGSVAVNMFNDYKLGIIILISHLFSSLLNGLFYRNIGTRFIQNDTKNTPNNISVSTKKSLNDVMYDTIISILMVGGYITLSFTLLEFITRLSIFSYIQNFFENTLNFASFESILKGMVELTNGCVSLVNTNISKRVLCILLTALTSFGGLSIHLQSQMFLSKVKIKYSYFLLTKVTQTIISILISGVFSMIFL